MLSLCLASGCTPAGLPAAPVTSAKKSYQDLVVGYAQIGAESEWRIANTTSMRETADELGVELKFADGQQKQENQIKALRTFIAMKLDVIGISPVVETGWESVFREVKDAGIPLILVDRRADVPEDLYATYLGSDFREEGRNSARVLAQLVHGNAQDRRTGRDRWVRASERSLQGFREVLEELPGHGDHRVETPATSRAPRAKRSWKTSCADTAREITAVFAHNDDMGLGAIQAIEEHGLRPGVDIQIVSVDSIRDAFQAMAEGKLNATIECNPLLGPQFYDLALKVVNGQAVPKWVPSKESVFLADTALESCQPANTEQARQKSSHRIPKENALPELRAGHTLHSTGDGWRYPGSAASHSRVVSRR